MGVNIVKVSPGNPNSFYYGVEIDGHLSILALISVQACINVIDTHIRRNKAA